MPQAKTVTDGKPLANLYRSVDMERAIVLEREFADAELGLVAQSANRYGYPNIN